MKLAVLGSPIAHSRSPELQRTFAGGDRDFSYIKIETTRDELPDTVRRLVSEGFDGFNCTMPLKTDMASLVDEITPEAVMLRSVNTVTIKEGRLYGDTTDGRGILLTVRRALGGAMGEAPESAVRGKKVLLLGAGGAARSVALSLSLAGAEIAILNRTESAAEELKKVLTGAGADAESVSVGCLNETELDKAAGGAEILVNCTSLGMSGKPGFQSLSFLDGMVGNALVIDAVYEPLRTALLAGAEQRGLRTAGGLWMLVYQGALAFRNWTGILPDEKKCGEAYRAISVGL